MFDNCIWLNKQKGEKSPIKLYTDMKKVYKMVDFLLDTEKVHMSCLRKEWLLLRSLNHPGIVKVGSWSDFGTYAYYEMDYLPNRFENTWKMADENKKDLMLESLQDTLKYLWAMGVGYGKLEVRGLRTLAEMPVLTDFWQAERVRVPEDFKTYLEANLGDSGGWEKFTEEVRTIKKGLF